MISLFLDPAGRILEANPALHEGLNILGKLYGIATPAFELEPADSAQAPRDVSPSRIHAAGPLVFARKGFLEWIAPDITGSRDLFYGRTAQGSWLLTDDFFHIASQVPRLTLPRDSFLYFMRHGYLQPGATLFAEIARARLGMKLVFSGSSLREEEVWEKEEAAPRDYETFKRAFSSVFAAYPFKDTAGVALSAGSDSGLAAAIAVLQEGKRPMAFTIVTPQQPLAINDIDEANAGRVARHLGLEHVAVEFDYNEHGAEELREAALAMPLAAHLSLHFFKLGQEARRLGVTQLWSGQSADSVYNLGPTWKSWGGPLRRFYLTKEYWQGFPDVAGNKLIGGAARLAGAVGPLAWRLAHKQALRQPASFRELMDAFAAAEGTPPFLVQGTAPLGRKRGQMTARQAREALFAWKLQAFLTGKDVKVLYAAADRSGFEMVLPYTTANMLQFFRGLEMGLRDVFAPKRFIYRYLEELLGKSAYRELYGKQESHASARPPLTWKQWQENVLTNTVLGQEMSEVAQKSGLLARFHAEREWNPSNFQHVLSLAWLHNVVSELQEQGVNARDILH